MRESQNLTGARGAHPGRYFSVLLSYSVLLLYGGLYTIWVEYERVILYYTILRPQVPFVGFNAVLTSERLAAHGAFALLQVLLSRVRLL